MPSAGSGPFSFKTDETLLFLSDAPPADGLYQRPGIRPGSRRRTNPDAGVLHTRRIPYYAARNSSRTRHPCLYPQRFRLGNRCIRCRRHPCRGNCRTACLFRWRPFPRTPPQGRTSSVVRRSFLRGDFCRRGHGTLRPGGRSRVHRTCSAYGSRRGDGLAS